MKKEDNVNDGFDASQQLFILLITPVLQTTHVSNGIDT